MENATDLPTTIAVWQRAIAPDAGRFDPLVARIVLEFHLAPQDLDRADALSAKARHGTLTADEDRELQSYLTVSSALQFLKSKARRSILQAAA